MLEETRLKSLKTKTIIFVLSITVISAVVSLFIILRVSEANLRKSHNVFKQATIESLSYSLAPMLETYDYRLIEQTIKASLMHQAVAGVSVYDDDGKRIRRGEKNGVPQESIVIESREVISKGEPVGRFETAFSDEYISKRMKSACRAVSAGLIGILMLMGIALYAYMDLSVIKPLARFTRTVTNIGPGNMSARIDIRKDDEIGILAGHFNSMAERLETAHRSLSENEEQLEELVKERTVELEAAQEKLVASERLAALGQFAGSIAHEIRNPLGVISYSTDFLERRIPDDDTKADSHILKIKRQLRRITDIIESILRLTNMNPPVREEFDLAAVVADALDITGIPENIELNFPTPAEHVDLELDRDQIAIAFKNILKNAFQAMPDGGKLDITVRSVNNNGTETAEVVFSDTGTGLSEEMIRKVFEPMYTTKTFGIGFGLAIVKMIVERHGGTILAESGAERGAVFTVSLPLKTK